MAKTTFDQINDIPSLNGKVILITGGTAGLGRATVLSLAAHEPAEIIFTGRSQTSADGVIEETSSKYPKVAITFVKCDLASLVSVQNAAREVVSKITRLDIVMANAGIMAVPPSLTEDGYEVQFGTNHVGHALLLKLLTPTIEATAREFGDARVVWTSSLAYKIQPKGGIQLDKVKTPQADIYPLAGGWMRYGQSKLANLLYARAFANHNPSITSVSIHPGVSYTGLVSSLSLAGRLFVYATTFWQALPAEACAYNQQWAATAPLGTGDRQVESGRYYEPVGIKGSLAGKATDDNLAERLWEWTQQELKAYELDVLLQPSTVV